MSIPKAKCHPSQDVFHNGECRSCYEKHLRQRNPEFAERQRENRRQWGLRNKERIKQLARIANQRISPEARRDRMLRYKYGITLAEYNVILKAQGGVCAICKKPSKRTLHVDHNHDTDEVRGLLCFRCNFGITWFKENAGTLLAASCYLVDSPAKYGGSYPSDFALGDFGPSARIGGSSNTSVDAPVGDFEPPSVRNILCGADPVVRLPRKKETPGGTARG